ncbi:MAG: tRNA lysidine(34) synthetase TilS [Alphaproteobacteria bacterium]|jgi:tRNA(Ile)-lysidine synthase|nr:tRNA lysidine(34) synthetase TilS [Alphaproteobacteria bacterium]
MNTLEINQDDFENNIKRLVVLPKSPKFLVATSGGADSLCLSIMLKKFSQKINAEVLSVIVDHKLREESTEEAKFVSNLLTNFGIKSVILTRDNIPLTTGIQSKARFDRYALLKNYAKEQGFPYLFVAHHLDDQLETIMQRKDSGENLVGNSGMSAKVVYPETILLRPFLSYTKKQIINTIKNVTDTWIEDPSNQNEKYTRVKYRKKINFLSSEEKQLLVQEYQKNAENRTDLENEVLEFLSQGILINKFGLIKLNLILLNKYRDNIKVLVLRKLLKFANGKNYEVKIEKVRVFLKQLDLSDSFKFSLGNCLLKVKKNELFIYKNRLVSNKIKANKPVNYWDNRFIFYNKNQDDKIFIDKISKETYFTKIKDKEFKKYCEKYGLDGDFVWGLPYVFTENGPKQDYNDLKHFNYKSSESIFMGFFSK